MAAAPVGSGLSAASYWYLPASLRWGPPWLGAAEKGKFGSPAGPRPGVGKPAQGWAPPASPVQLEADPETSAGESATVPGAQARGLPLRVDPSTGRPRSSSAPLPEADRRATELPAGCCVPSESTVQCLARSLDRSGLHAAPTPHARTLRLGKGGKRSVVPGSAFPGILENKHSGCPWRSLLALLPIPGGREAAVDGRSV